jgi:hypothetical protein
MNLKVEYDQDFYCWISKNVELLRNGRLAELDVEHIAEELESMGKRDLRELRSRLQVLVMHLLTWKYQPEKQSKSWSRTIDQQRNEIEDLLLDSPSLRGQLVSALEIVYTRAKQNAHQETGLPEEVFPSYCPFELTEILDQYFLPEN